MKRKQGVVAFLIRGWIDDVVASALEATGIAADSRWKSAQAVAFA